MSQLNNWIGLEPFHSPHPASSLQMHARGPAPQNVWPVLPFSFTPLSSDATVCVSCKILLECEASRFGGTVWTLLHRVWKKRPTVGLLQLWHTWMDFDVFFGRNVTDKVGNQKTLDYATSCNLCLCTNWQNGLTRKSHFHLQCTCAMSSWKKKVVICDVFDSV